MALLNNLMCVVKLVKHHPYLCDIFRIEVAIDIDIGKMANISISYRYCIETEASRILISILNSKQRPPEYWYWYWNRNRGLQNIDIGLEFETETSRILILILNSKQRPPEYWYWYRIRNRGHQNIDIDLEFETEATRILILISNLKQG